MGFFSSKINPVLFIAEIGGNHEGNFAYAQRLMELALDSGADIVKLQIYTGDTLASSVERPDLNQHFKRFELAREHYVALAQKCVAHGVMFMASVWNEAALRWIDPYIPIHKVGSGDLTCWPLIRKLIETGKPLILSTGLSSMAEIEATVGFIDGVDTAYLREYKLALLQCTSSYPCLDEDINLRAMETLKSRFGLPVGFSDHSIGALAVEAAVAMGAVIIEKHFTDTREGKTFRDHQVSITRDELRELMPRLRRIATLRGEPAKHLTVSEAEASHQVSFRRSVYASRDIATGEVFGEHNLTVLRPAVGVPANRFDEILGQTANRTYAAQEVIREEDLGRV